MFIEKLNTTGSEKLTVEANFDLDDKLLFKKHSFCKIILFSLFS